MSHSGVADILLCRCLKDGYRPLMRLVDFSIFAPSSPQRLPSTVSPPLLFSLGSTPVSCHDLHSATFQRGLIRVSTVLTYVDVSASLLPDTGALSFYLVAIANASSMFGRYAAGSISDRLGRV